MISTTFKNREHKSYSSEKPRNAVWLQNVSTNSSPEKKLIKTREPEKKQKKCRKLDILKNTNTVISICLLKV